MHFGKLLFFSSTLLFADNLSSSLSLQGFTGLINTPNAQVIPEGNAILHYNNQFDNHLQYYDYTRPYNTEDDYIVGMGFLPSFELSARLVEAKGYARDLSGNIKYKLPYSHSYLPNLALGVQDLGGAYSFYTNYYVVLDKEIGIFRPSFGYGKSSNSLVQRKRMDGLFGGVEAQVTDWFSVMVEYDGKENHTAIRFKTPKDWISSFNLETTLVQNLTHSETSFAINVSIPLFHNIQKEMKYTQQVNSSVSTLLTPKIEKAPTPKESFPTKISNSTLNTIQKMLIKIGFENLQVGLYDKSIYIKAENNIFDHTDLDALGVIMGTIVQEVNRYNHYTITLLKNNIQTLTISGDTKSTKKYFENPTIDNKESFKNSLIFSRNFNEDKVQFITQKQNSSFFVPRLELSPGLTTTVGTEVGAFDYLVALRANAYTTLYNGLTLSAMYEIPFVNSKNFDEGYTYGVMYKDKLDNRLVNAMLHQTLHYNELINTTSVGQFQSDYYGILNHTNFTTTSGEHGLNLKLGSFKNKNDKSDETRNIYIGSYRYFYAPLDLFAEIGYGQYWEQDKGAILSFKRFFGETEVSLYLKDSVKTYAGFTVTVPFTTRKSYNSKWGQVKGKKDFNYGIRTVVKSPDHANYLNPGGAIIPKTDLELTTHYLDRDRLNGSYIKKHIDRMREAYLIYGRSF